VEFRTPKAAKAWLKMMQQRGIILISLKKVIDTLDRFIIRSLSRQVMSLCDLLLVQERIGKDGVPFGCYKLRTMDPTVSVSPDELNQRRGKWGKIEDDPRVTLLGKFLRRYWIDETPQIVNILRGEMRFIGIRPFMREHFERRPPDLREEIVKYKPGLIGVTYAEDGNKIYGWERAMEAERRYLERKQEHPILTDVVYFARVMYNIVFYGARGI